MMQAPICCCRLYIAGQTGPVVFCLHGGGYTGLTWAVMAASAAGQVIEMQCSGQAPGLAQSRLQLFTCPLWQLRALGSTAAVVDCCCLST